MVPKPSDSLQYRKNRLATFKEGAKFGNSKSLKQWSNAVDADNLADCGFYYSPTKGSPNQITCYWCGKKEKNIEEKTPVATQHLLTNPKCPYSLIACNLKQFIMTTEKDTFWSTLGESGSAPKSIIEPHSNESIALRRSTFKNLWKFDSKRKCKVSSKGLSQAGFYYSPVEAGSDRVICMYCDCPLEDWDRNDDPLQEHKNNSFTYCYFLDTIGKELTYGTILPANKPATEDHSNIESDSEISKQAELGPEEEAQDGSDLENDAKIQQSELSQLLGHTSSPTPAKIDESSLRLLPKEKSPNDSILDLLLSDSHIQTRENSHSPGMKRQEVLEHDDGFDAFDFSIDDLENQDKGTIFNNKEIIPQRKYSRKTKRQRTATSLPKKETKVEVNSFKSERNLPLNTGLSSPGSGALDFQDVYRNEFTSLPGIINLSPSTNRDDVSPKIRESFILNSEIEDHENRDQDESDMHGIGMVSELTKQDTEDKDAEEEEDDSLSLQAKSDSEYTLGAEDSEIKASTADESLVPDETTSILSEVTVETVDQIALHEPLINNKKRKDENKQKLSGQKRQKQPLSEQKEKSKSQISRPKMQKSLFSDDMDIDQAQLDKILNSPKKGRKMKVLKTAEEVIPTPAIFDLSNQNIGDYDESNISFIEGDVRLPAKSETLKMLGAFKISLLRDDKAPNKSDAVSKSPIDMNSSPSKELGSTEIKQIELTVNTENPVEVTSRSDSETLKIEAKKLQDQFNGVNEDTKSQGEGKIDKSIIATNQGSGIDTAITTSSNTKVSSKNSFDVLVLDTNPTGDEISASTAVKIHDSPEIHGIDPSEPLGEVAPKLDFTNQTITTNPDKTSQNGLQSTMATGNELEQSFSEDHDNKLPKEDHIIQEENTEGYLHVGAPDNKNILFEANVHSEVEATSKTDTPINADLALHPEYNEHKASEVCTAPLEVAFTQKLSAKAERKPDNPMPVSSDELKVLFKEELRKELKAQLREELRAEIQRELLKEELRAEIQKELLQERASKDLTLSQEGSKMKKPGVYGDSIDEKIEKGSSKYQQYSTQVPNEPSKDDPVSEVDVSGMQNIELSPSSYREYVEDLERMDEEFPENTIDLPKRENAADGVRSEDELSHIEDSASEQPELLQLSEKEIDGTTSEKRGSEEIGSSHSSITSPLAQGSTFNDHDTESEGQSDGQSLHMAATKPQPFSYGGLESSPQNVSVEKNASRTRHSVEHWKTRKLPTEDKIEQEILSESKMSKPYDGAMLEVKRLAHDPGLSQLSLEQIVSEMQALLDTIDYLSEVSATRRELHDDAEGLVTLFVAAMPEEEEYLGVKDWMLHNASTCGRTVREISGKLIAAYEHEFEKLINEVECMDTVD